MRKPVLLMLLHIWRRPVYDGLQTLRAIGLYRQVWDSCTLNKTHLVIWASPGVETAALSCAKNVIIVSLL